MPRVPLSHVLPDQFKSWAGAACAALVLGACGSSAKTDDPTLGRVGFAIEFPDGVDIEYVDYEVDLTFLEEQPPETYLHRETHETRRGGELTEVVPCHTTSSGTGLNQVDITAYVKVPSRDEPYKLQSSAVFQCKRNADTLVNVTLSLLGAYDGGFVDIDAIPIGTLCSSAFTQHADTTYGVCGEAACGRGDGEDYWVFASHCESLQAQTPTFWICGSPADWNVNFEDATAYFPPPQHDGQWSFGVVALDGYTMAQADPTLTDPSGKLTVWTGASGTKANLTRTNGHVVANGSEPEVYLFAADLELAPDQVGLPVTHVLMLVHETSIGSRIAYQTKFGACDQPALDVSLYPGSPMIDVRRESADSVKLILADPATGFATLVAHCQTDWDRTGPAPKPVVRCGAPSPILP